MKKIVLLLVALSVITCKVMGQVETRYFQNGEANDHFNYQKANFPPHIYVLPRFDVDSMLVEDKEMEDCDVPFRFGKAFDTNITLEDSDWEYEDESRIWSMTFKSAHACSLNFVFENFYLPEGGELYIVSKNGNVEYGPVTSKTINGNGSFLSNIIPDSCVTVYLKEPLSKKGQSTLTIRRVVHGYKYR